MTKMYQFNSFSPITSSSVSNILIVGKLALSNSPMSFNSSSPSIDVNFTYFSFLLLLHCPSIWGLWESLISIAGLAWVCPLLLKDLFLGWTVFPIKKRARKLWRTAPLGLLWAIWKERNRIVFDDVPLSLSRLKSSFVSLLIS